MSDFFLPPEWAKQKSVWLSWPHNKETWEQEILKRTEEEYAVFVKELASEIVVNILILDLNHEIHVRTVLGNYNSKIEFHMIKTNDAWMRDHGPDFVWNRTTKKKELLNWGYNSWGGKYPPFEDDNLVPHKIAEIEGLKEYQIQMILEGGSFEVNGKGDLMTTESCLLNPNRNSELTKAEIENHLKSYLGVNQIIWFKEGIKGDDTDGHIDDFARFINETTIVHAWTEDKNHPDYEVLKEIRQKLKEIKLWNNQSPKLIPLPVPKPLFFNKELLPCSYVNFLITNNKVLMPAFGCKEDKIALEILQKEVVDRKIIEIPANNIIIGLGSLHCLSKQEFDSTIFD